jgi:hypothetical protein
MDACSPVFDFANNRAAGLLNVVVFRSYCGGFHDVTWSRTQVISVAGASGAVGGALMRPCPAPGKTRTAMSSLCLQPVRPVSRSTSPGRVKSTKTQAGTAHLRRALGVEALAVARSPTAAIWERNTGAAARPKPSLPSSGPCWSSSTNDQDRSFL